MISEKSVGWANSMIKVYQSIVKAHNEDILSKQFFRSSTVMGAFVGKAVLPGIMLHLYKHNSKDEKK
jgi:hypothetical protein